jgi:hypothetical protein
VVPVPLELTDELQWREQCSRNSLMCEFCSLTHLFLIDSLALLYISGNLNLQTAFRGTKGKMEDTRISENNEFVPLLYSASCYGPKFCLTGQLIRAEFVHLFPTLHLVMSWYLEISHGGIYLRNC